MKHSLRFFYQVLPLLLLGWLCCCSALAQDRRITGRIIDENDNNTLPGANVVVKGTQVGIVTDADGQFTLNVPSGRDVLTISAIGYVSKDVTIGNRTAVNVGLLPDVKTLN